MNTLNVEWALTALTVLFVTIGSGIGGSTSAIIVLLLAMAMVTGRHRFSDPAPLPSASLLPVIA